MPDTIVMIHGMWGGAWCWDNYKSFFENKGYRCLTPILRYHDQSPQDPPNPLLGTVSLLDYAQDVEKIIRELNVKPIIMGHSMGGLISQILASRGLAKGLVLLTSAPPHGIMALKPSVIKAFWSIMTTWGFWRLPIRMPFEPAVESMMHLLSEKEQRETYDKFVYESGRAAFEIGFWLLDKRNAAKVDEQKITCPVLVVTGEEDRITPASVGWQISKKYGADYKEFPRHAHYVISEPMWEEISEYVYQWLKALKA